MRTAHPCQRGSEEGQEATGLMKDTYKGNLKDIAAHGKPAGEVCERWLLPYPPQKYYWIFIFHGKISVGQGLWAAMIQVMTTLVNVCLETQFFSPEPLKHSFQVWPYLF